MSNEESSETKGEQSQHVAIPTSLLNAVIVLIGEEIQWNKANNVMSALKTSCVAVNLKGGEPPKE